MKTEKVKMSVAQLCLTLWEFMDLCPWNSPGKNTGVCCHFFSGGSSWPRGQTWVSCIEGRFSTVWAVGEALGMTCLSPCFKPPQQCDPCRLTPQRTPHSAGQHLLRACPGPAAIRCDKMIRAPAPLPSSPPPFQACQLPAPFYCCPNK